MRLDRLNSMEQHILQHGTASLEDLATRFHISTNTVRRDIAELLSRGQIKKVYGGVAACATPALPPVSVRAERERDAKREIGRLAAELVEDHATVFLDSGSTTICILPHLANKNGVTVITHSLSALYEASKYPELRVIALGGLYSAPTSSYVGVSTLETLSRMSIDLIFIAATGVSLERGLTNTTYFEAEIKRTVAKHNKHILLMADHSKFDHAALFTFCEFRDLSGIITDRKPAKPYLDAIEQNGIRLVYPEEN
ncbi:MAG TPA: DeoR/GlpR family DNA-binding transcription regulator [Feifaniaceae bacterium]|nr:DeoR/GlpR family DNA-binding transcription regulator [Feifaniaceae bacterium]